MITIRPIDEIFQLGDLFGSSGHPEGSAEWFAALAATTLHSSETAKLVLIKDENGAVRGALPLVYNDKRSVRGLTAPYTTVFVPALPDVEWARRLGEQVSRYVNGSLSLEAVAVELSGLSSYLRGLKSSSFSYAEYRHFENWFEPIHDFQRYWSSRSSRVRSTIKRKLNQARNRGTLRFDCAKSVEDVTVAFDQYLDVYENSWKIPEPHPHFMRTMVSSLSKAELVRIAVLSLDREPIAAQVWLVKDGHATIFKLAHKETAATMSPGSLLTHWMLERLTAEDDVKLVDFGRGNDSYKREWLHERQFRYGVTIANRKNLAGWKIIASTIIPTHLSNFMRETLRNPN